jgi:hypothetical protein
MRQAGEQFFVVMAHGGRGSSLCRCFAVDRIACRNLSWARCSATWTAPARPYGRRRPSPATHEHHSPCRQLGRCPQVSFNVNGTARALPSRRDLTPVRAVPQRVGRRRDAVRYPHRWDTIAEGIAEADFSRGTRVMVTGPPASPGVGDRRRRAPPGVRGRGRRDRAFRPLGCRPAQPMPYFVIGSSTLSSSPLLETKTTSSFAGSV